MERSRVRRDPGVQRSGWLFDQREVAIARRSRRFDRQLARFLVEGGRDREHDLLVLEARAGRAPMRVIPAPANVAQVGGRCFDGGDLALGRIGGPGQEPGAPIHGVVQQPGLRRRDEPSGQSASRGLVPSDRSRARPHRPTAARDVRPRVLPAGQDRERTAACRTPPSRPVPRSEEWETAGHAAARRVQPRAGRPTPRRCWSCRDRYR